MSQTLQDDMGALGSGVWGGGGVTELGKQEQTLGGWGIGGILSPMRWALWVG